MIRFYSGIDDRYPNTFAPTVCERFPRLSQF
jgi:hypothetical protein